MTMSKRKLGRQGLEVSAIGLGCMGMSQSYGPADEAESIATLHRAIELGCTFFDTAEVYGPFTNEELLGRALEGPARRGDRSPPNSASASRAASRSASDATAGPSTSARRSRARCTRLQTDHIDLLYQHRVDPAVPIEDVAGAVGDLVRRGQGPLLRPVGGRRRQYPPRPCRPSGLRAAERIFAVGAQSGGRRSSRPCANSASASCRSRRSAAAS